MAFSSDNPLQSNQLPISIEFPSVKKDFDEIISLTYKRIADAVNRKEGSVFQLLENASFSQYFKYTTGTTPDPNNFRNGYRSTFDLVALFGAAIPVGVTLIDLNVSAPSQVIIGALNPVRGYGGATIAGPTFIFINDPGVFVRFNNATQIITITNTVAPLTQAYWVMEYLKN